MRRQLLHIAAALLSFTVAFLTADSPENFVYALPLALATFVITKATGYFDIDFQFLLVAALSLVCWTAVGLIAVGFLSFHSGYRCGASISDAAPNPRLPSIPSDTIITLERTGCYGRCPSYALSIFADGSVFYYAEPSSQAYLSRNV